MPGSTTGFSYKVEASKGAAFHGGASAGAKIACMEACLYLQSDRHISSTVADAIVQLRDLAIRVDLQEADVTGLMGPLPRYGVALRVEKALETRPSDIHNIILELARVCNKYRRHASLLLSRGPEALLVHLYFNTNAADPSSTASFFPLLFDPRRRHDHQAAAFLYFDSIPLCAQYVGAILGGPSFTSPVEPVRAHCLMMRSDAPTLPALPSLLDDYTVMAMRREAPQNLESSVSPTPRLPSTTTPQPPPSTVFGTRTSTDVAPSTEAMQSSPWEVPWRPGARAVDAGGAASGSTATPDSLPGVNGVPEPQAEPPNGPLYGGDVSSAYPSESAMRRPPQPHPYGHSLTGVEATLAADQISNLTERVQRLEEENKRLAAQKSLLDDQLCSLQRQYETDIIMRHARDSGVCHHVID
ncbi:unnamed protein product [Vitrella brassicaformis CCMP3155]|uniref:Uncharacterized protein n=1 Tax=Vitrella brassicaformis (strain CCMP3155) TaxID=1169540 RepID=A0A0G4FX69_VITBC|nr:unnamed protein product [Vitrella brassicaformis CCMP3155]|eukprot:CEM19579.1 unnamed protein product [Vitrella brassicaformis CCMP3155]